GFELKRVHLENQKIVVLGFRRSRARGQRAMAAQRRFAIVVRKQLFDEFARGAFPIRSRDGNVQAVGLLVTQLKLTNDRHVAADHLAEDGSFTGNSRTDHGEAELAVRRLGDPGLDFDAGGTEWW